MPDFPVSGGKKQALLNQMHAWGIKESDLEEKFLPSRGPGGQHVNKTSTSVVLKHRPTGLEVRCQQERSQSLNRFLARRLLVEKLQRLIQGQASAEAQRQAKIRRQKNRRSRRSKEKILTDKHFQTRKKQQRSIPGSSELNDSG